MSSYMPTLKQLQYLVALKQHGHFGKAADNCYVTQSTLSAGIRELESLIGVTLVERTRRVVRFTALGDRIVEKAHRVLREAEELAALAEASGKPLTGELRMGVIPTIAPFLLPRLLPRLRGERPELKLYLREETSQAAIESLRHGNVDCVLLALPFPTGELDSELLFEDRLYVAFPHDDPHDPPEWIAPEMIDERSCAGGLQQTRNPRQRHDDGHIAAHAGADGGQWPGYDDHAGDGDFGRHIGPYPDHHTAASIGPLASRHCARLAEEQSTGEGIQTAGGTAARRSQPTTGASPRAGLAHPVAGLGFILLPGAYPSRGPVAVIFLFPEGRMRFQPIDEEGAAFQSRRAMQ
jgi:DNA-binding transcriptional LysR family regulator